MSKSHLRKAIGPGLLYAGAAIGVSHLVQSTRAGAEFGFTLLGIVLLACVTKYVFIEFGPRYTAATGETLIQGYNRLGKWALGLYVMATLGTMFTVQAAVMLVAAGLLGNLMGQLFGIVLSTHSGENIFYWSLVMFGLSALPLLLGRYGLLDLMVKLIISLLSFTTVVAVVMAASKGMGAPVDGFEPPAFWTLAALAATFALMGWMPTPIDVAVWQSLWTLGRKEQTHYAPTVREVRIDLLIGYGTATVLAVFFLALGALVMYGSGRSFPDGAIPFAATIITMYTEALGGWSWWLISIAAFTAMYSTTLTVTDAYPRVWRHFTDEVGNTQRDVKKESPFGVYVIYLFGINVVAMFIIGLVTLYGHAGLFAWLVSIASGLCVLTAPVLGYLNLKLITSDATPAEHRPGRAMLIWSWVSLTILMVLAVTYLCVLLSGRVLM